LHFFIELLLFFGAFVIWMLFTGSQFATSLPEQLHPTATGADATHNG